MEKGWVKLYRVLLDKYIWLNSTPEQKVILITLLLMANHEPHKWVWNKKEYEVQRGQFITSINSIVQKCGKGISTQNVRSALNKFKKHGFLTIEATNTNSLITITNWEEYQPKVEKVTNEPTENQQAPNKEVTTNKNDKNEKNLSIHDFSSEKPIERISSKDIDEIYKAYPSRCPIQNRSLGKSKKDKDKIKALLKHNTKDELLKTIELYISDCVNTDAYVKNLTTFLNNLPDTESLKEQVKQPIHQTDY